MANTRQSNIVLTEITIRNHGSTRRGPSNLFDDTATYFVSLSNAEIPSAYIPTACHQTASRIGIHVLIGSWGPESLLTYLRDSPNGIIP